MVRKIFASLVGALGMGSLIFFVLLMIVDVFGGGVDWGAKDLHIIFAFGLFLLFFIVFMCISFAKK